MSQDTEKESELEKIRGNDLSEDQEQFLRGIVDKLEENTERLDDVAAKITDEDGLINTKTLDIVKVHSNLEVLIELIELRLEWGEESDEFSGIDLDKFFDQN